MATYQVTGASALTTQMASVAAGDTIELQTANYGTYTFTNASFASDVTITVGAGQTATFEGIYCTNCDHIKFVGLNVTRTTTFANGSTAQLAGADGTSTFITYESCTLTAPFAAAYEGGYAVWFQTGASNCTLTKCIVDHARIGVVFIEAPNTTLTLNLFNDLGEDCLKGAGDGSVVTYNAFLGGFFGGAGDHHDWLQVNNSVDGMTISFNVVVPAANQTFQGIFFGGGTGGQDHSNITIEGNVILCNNNLGIAVKTAVTPPHTGTGVVIRRNTVGFFPDDPAVKKATYIGWPGATLEYNVTGRNVSPGPGIVTAGQELALTPYNQPQTYGTNNFYADIAQPLNSTLTAADFAIVAGSLVDDATYPTTYYGATDTIKQWIANGSWPPAELPTQAGPKALPANGLVTMAVTVA